MHVNGYAYTCTVYTLYRYSVYRISISFAQNMYNVHVHVRCTCMYMYIHHYNFIVCIYTPGQCTSVYMYMRIYTFASPNKNGEVLEPLQWIMSPHYQPPETQLAPPTFTLHHLLLLGFQDSYEPVELCDLLRECRAETLQERGEGGMCVCGWCRWVLVFYVAVYSSMA